jgi:hypothetical protein
VVTPWRGLTRDDISFAANLHLLGPHEYAGRGCESASRPADQIRNSISSIAMTSMNFFVSDLSNLIHTHRNDFTIVAVIILGALVTLAISASGGRRLLARVLRMITGPKLSFTAHERGIVWFGTITDRRFIVSLNGLWSVTNAARRNVTLKSFYVDGLATEHHMLMSVSGPREGGALIPAGETIDVETFCLVQKTLTWRSGTFVADICFVDDAGDVHKMRNVRFNHIKQSLSPMTETVLSPGRREVA